MRKLPVNQKGFSHVLIIIIGVFLAAIISFASWRVFSVRHKTPQSDNEKSYSGYTLLSGKSYKTTKFEQDGHTLVYPSEWGNFVTKTKSGVQSENFVFQGSFDRLGEKNELEVYAGTPILGRLIGNVKEGCGLFDTEKQIYYSATDRKPKPSEFPECYLYDEGNYPDTPIKAYNSARLLFLHKENGQTFGPFSPKTGLMYYLTIRSNKNDGLDEGRSTGCCALPPTYKQGTNDRLYEVYVDVASVLIEHNK